MNTLKKNKDINIKNKLSTSIEKKRVSKKSPNYIQQPENHQ